jgi:uncharacterized protein YprB with RNaseH-like and TPR domain
VRVEDGCVSPADVIGFCEAQALARDAEPGQAGGGFWAGASLSMQQDLGVLEVDGPVMFLDLETTGLSGGAGTVPFLVGIGFFENGAFRTRQFLLPGFASERALLHAVAECLGEAGCLVTYNGKTFDLPVMETRWSFQRMTPCWDALPHLDLLHLARRLWGRREDVAASSLEGGCRLVALEQALLGVERVGDVPGFEIPARYFDFVRHGYAQALEPVLHHNRLDLVSLGCLTARAARLIEEGPSEASDGAELVALGREYARRGDVERAEECFRRGLERHDVLAETRADAQYGLARLLRRRRDYGAAAEMWQALAGNRMVRPPVRHEANEALAVHYEHRARDLRLANRWAREAAAESTSPRQRIDLARRLARLDRKLAGHQPIEGMVPLPLDA